MIIISNHSTWCNIRFEMKILYYKYNYMWLMCIKSVEGDVAV